MKAEKSEQELRRRVVGKYLRDKRAKAGLTQWDVAHHLHYSTAQFISNWERGVALPPIDAMPKIAALIGAKGGEFINVIQDYQEQLLKLSKRQLLDVFRNHGA